MRLLAYLLLGSAALCADVSKGSADMPSVSLQHWTGGRAEGFSNQELCDIAARVALLNGLPVPFFMNLIFKESGFRPEVISRAGALGIAQFMPEVAAENGLDDPLEPAAALVASGKLLAELWAQFGNLGLAAAAYNAGPRRVSEWLDAGGKLPAETQRYVLSITGRTAQYWTKIGALWTEDTPIIARCPLAKADTASRTVQSSRFPRRPGAGQITKRVTGSGFPRPSQFAIGKPVSPFIRKLEKDHRSRKSTAHKSQPAMDRFLKMATPIIAREEKR